jgi:hypothetical protein
LPIPRFRAGLGTGRIGADQRRTGLDALDDEQPHPLAFFRGCGDAATLGT